MPQEQEETPDHAQNQALHVPGAEGYRVYAQKEHLPPRYQARKHPGDRRRRQGRRLRLLQR